VTWFKVDDGFWGHPKRMACTPTAIGIWATAGSWSAQQLTDGVVPAHVLAVLAGKPRDAQVLVAAGLWHAANHTCRRCPPITSGWVFHDWIDWQPTRQKVHDKRAAEAQRKQEWRDRKRTQREGAANVPAGQDEDDGGTRPSGDAGPTQLSALPDPTRPDPTRKEQNFMAPGSAERETKPRKPRAPDPIWDALVAACGVDTTSMPDSARSACNGAVAQLRRIGAEPSEILRRAEAFRRHWPQVTLTPTALVRRWSEVTQPPPPPATRATAPPTNERLWQQARQGAAS